MSPDDRTAPFFFLLCQSAVCSLWRIPERKMSPLCKRYSYSHCSSFGPLHKLSWVQGGDLAPFHASLQFLISTALGERKDLDGSHRSSFLPSSPVESRIWVAGADLKIVLKNDKWPGPEVNDLPKSQGECCSRGSQLTVERCSHCPGLPCHSCLHLFRIFSPAQVHTAGRKSLSLLLPSEVFGLGWWPNICKSKVGTFLWFSAANQNFLKRLAVWLMILHMTKTHM